MNWVYSIIEFNKVGVFVMYFSLPAIFFLTFAVLYVTLSQISLAFILTPFITFILALTPFHIFWTGAKNEPLKNSWYVYRNRMNKSIYHLLECYKGNLNELRSLSKSKSMAGCISGIIEETLTEMKITHEKDSIGALRGRLYLSHFLIFPSLLPSANPLSLFLNFSAIRNRVPEDAELLDLPDKKLHIVVGVESVGSLISVFGIPVDSPYFQYIQICGIDDKNTLFARELELKITEKLKQNPNIRFLTPESTKYDIN